MLSVDGPDVAHVHGVPGIGKTTLLRAFVAAASAKGHLATFLDCSTIEPTEAGFLRELRSAGLLARAGKRAPRLAVLDNYENFQLLDAWLRGQFLPKHPGFRLVLGARRPPGTAWIASVPAFLSLRIEELDAETALAVLGQAGLSKASARRALGFTRGHPLALTLAAAATKQRIGDFPDDLAVTEVVTRLSDLFLAESDPAHQLGIEAMSTVRRVTEPLLAAMLGLADASDVYRFLQNSSLVEPRVDGLSLHPAVQEVIARRLRAADPARFTGYRRAAWRVLESQSSAVAASELWRYTADVIYLIENAIVREAFFPSNQQALSVESARPEDREAVMRIAQRHDGKGGREHMEHWWSALPSSFRVVREPGEAIVGFYCMFDPARPSAAAIKADPMTAAWHAELPAHLRAPGRVLFLRRWLGDLAGEAPSAVQAACWLDVKRAYVEMRPLLQRVYLAVADLAPYAPAALELGFQAVCAQPRLPLASAMLEFGPGSVDAWLRRLMRKELQLNRKFELDAVTGELVMGAGRQVLSRLEHGVLQALLSAEGCMLERRRLMDAVWGSRQRAVGSNVLDVVILSLRKKLGPHADALQTVRGKGYRLVMATNS